MMFRSNSVEGQASGSNEPYLYFTIIVFGVFDANHDDSIDFSEFVLACCSQNKGDFDSKLKLIFAM